VIGRGLARALASILPLSAALMTLAPGPASAVGAPHVPGTPGWQQRVHYRFQVTYTPAAHQIAGQETLTYWNQSPDTLESLWFHLYLNAYRPGSHLARRSADRENWRVADLPASKRGGEWIERAALLEGDSLRVELDDTIARLLLPRPIAPGESAVVCLRFRSVIPDLPARLGRTGRGVFAALWYPRVSVYDRYGWDRNQHVGSEFYGDYGTFDVRLTLPGSFLVAHTGQLCNPEDVLPDSIRSRLDAPGDSAVTVWDRSLARAPADSTARKAYDAPRTWVFHADSVHDFAWACDEKWIWRRARWNGIDVNTFHRAADWSRWNGIAAFGARTMEILATRLGPYPYPAISVVEQPIGAGGVEFPNIVWISPRYRKDGTRRLDAVVAHEIGHNWFYGMVGNNETEQAFLDEGFASYCETLVMEAVYGRRGNTLAPGTPRWLHPSDDSRTAALRNYLEYQGQGVEEPIVTHSDRFRNPGAYNPAVYAKAETGLWTLRSIAGEERFDRALRAYFATWRFHHPYAEDFFASMDEALGESYDWFFRGWFLRTDTVDLRLRSLRSAPLQDSFQVELSLDSRGGLDVPVPVRFRGAKGAEAWGVVPRTAFLGSAGYGIYRTTLPFRPNEAELDPEITLPDLNRGDNRTSRMPRFQTMVDNLRSSPHPLDRTLLLWRPDLWYQSDAGPELGVAFDASTPRWERAARGLAGFQAREPRPYADLEARIRSVPSNPRGIASARGYDMDGHRGARVAYTQGLGRPVEVGFRWMAAVGVDVDRLYDRDQPRRPDEWSSGGYANLEGTLAGTRRFRRVQWAGSLRLRGDLLTSRYSYGSLYAATTATISAVPKLPLALRAVYGRVRGDAVPPEERFGLAGAGPRGEWGSRWFRSRGTIPTRWSAALGGDGNVRAFADERPSGRALFALNAEARFTRLFPAWAPGLAHVRVPVLDPRPSLFADWGNVAENSDGLFHGMRADFGVGLRTKPLFKNRLVLRVDAPIYRSPPRPDEDRFRLRGVFSVGEAF